MQKSSSTTPPRKAARPVAKTSGTTNGQTSSTRDRGPGSLSPAAKREREKERPKVDIFQQGEIVQQTQQPEAPKIDHKMAELFTRVFSGHVTSIPKPLSKLIIVNISLDSMRCDEDEPEGV